MVICHGTDGKRTPQHGGFDVGVSEEGIGPGAGLRVCGKSADRACRGRGGQPRDVPEAGAADRGAQVHTDQQGVTGTPGRKSLCAWSPVQGGVSEGVEGLLVGGGL